MLITLKNVSLSYGLTPLLDHAHLSVDHHERIALLGRNGAGKSTLLQVLCGTTLPDDGEIWRADPLRISYLEQELPTESDERVYDLVARGLGTLGELLTTYHTLTKAQHLSPQDFKRLTEVQHQIEIKDGWNTNHRIETVLSRLSLPEDLTLKQCSGGIRRRVLLAKALVSDPELLLLDEPTNHMDIAAIDWLENYLKEYQGTLIFITHDRTFLQNLATRVIELDRGQLLSSPGDYKAFLRKKEEALVTERRATEKFDKQLSEHEVWIRQGVKARRTRNQGRVNTLLTMRQTRAERVSSAGKVRMDVDSGEGSGKIVADLRDVSLTLGDRCIINQLNLRILRNDRIGIIGPNGAGKSTLLKIILGELKPDTGQVTLGTRLQVAYFDQQREQLDLTKTVRDNVNDGNDYVTVGGRSRHVISYLRDFLFSPERADHPTRILSGGERNRLLLARLFTRPSNLLVLDEPTNDLDVETLELLEELLVEYEGTLLLVSHDRSIIDNVVTSTVVFEADGRLCEYVGGYEDYQRQHKAKLANARSKAAPSASPKKPAALATSNKTTKLGFKEKKELETLPQTIESVEADLQRLEAEISDLDFFKQDKTTITQKLALIDTLREKLQQSYARWTYLDSQELR